MEVKLIDILNKIAKNEDMFPKIEFQGEIYEWKDTGYTNKLGEYLGDNISVPVDEFEILNTKIKVVEE